MPIPFNGAAVFASILPNTGGWVSSLTTRETIRTWYQTLNKPSWTPPDWMFGPVWTLLYSSMGYASYLVFRDGGGFNGAARLPLIAYCTQLATNWAWSPIFFGARNPKIAFYDILLLWSSAGATGLMFYQVNKIAGYIFIPYMMWLTLASCLNYRIMKDNPRAIEAPKES